MKSHFSALEADFQRDYGLNLRECVWEFNVPRMMSLVKGLDPSGALAREENEIWWWNNEVELLASIFDKLNVMDYNFIRANTSEKDQGKVKKPERIPRPGEQRTSTTMDEFKSIILGDKAGNG